MAYELKHSTSKEVGPGTYYPMGAALRDGGVNFSVYSRYGEQVFLLLFDSPGSDPTDIIEMDGPDKYIWHAFVKGAGEGQLYAYKARGEYDPANGKRFNENKLLMDPYARALTGKYRNTGDILLPYKAGDDLRMDDRDDTKETPKCVVIGNSFDWQGDGLLYLDFEKLFIYEVHVKGFTAHPSSGVSNPGTYLGFIDKIPYLKSLGVNAVELLPVQEKYPEDYLVKKGLTNYWGYNTIGFFAPEWSYSTMSEPGCQVREFKTLVRELHKAGIEVILDVVYNHTGEGNHLGPMICFKGIDNGTYYCLSERDGMPYGGYYDLTGCNNTLNFSCIQVIRFVMDSLRYWVNEMHVDGFRFDLAAILGSNGGFYHKTASFFDAIAQDPVLSRVKLIAEPWAARGDNMYQTGNFPLDWSEWNDKFRDTMRRFAKSDPGQLVDFGKRFTGSADLYEDDGRTPYNSVNFITCHDGFTLHDLVSYNSKHNEANQENSGSDNNNSWNCGVEGETDDANVTRLRKQIAKDHFCHLFFSSGTPMALGGDEFFRTQKGNNNAYCQDNEISWFDWDYAAGHSGLTEFFRKAIAFTKRFPALQRRKFFRDDPSNPEIIWYGPDGDKPLWDDPDQRTLCCMLEGSKDGQDLFFIFNADWNPRTVALPPLPGGAAWLRAIDTSLPAGEDILDEGAEAAIDPPGVYNAAPRSTVVLVGMV